ncbi:MAG TPA: ATP-binding protein [bacterium]|nr:ATP-binding protein [bacterium]
MIDRPTYIRRIHRAFDVHPVVALLGPRQCGKTTLANMLADASTTLPVTLFDLENPVDRQRLAIPMQTLSRLNGLIIIDEFQRAPELLEILRVIVDKPGQTARFLILGSASPAMIRGSSETLAGRIGFVDMSGFSIHEVPDTYWERLWIRGGFPRSCLAPDDAAGAEWRNAFIRTFLERDIPQLGIRIPAETLRRFWTMIAHYHAQIWNGSELARALGTSEHTVRHYLDILAGAYMVRVLPPWFANIKKRQVKAPKVYLRDSGILHSLFGLTNRREVSGHPKAGASWEGFVLEQFILLHDLRNIYYWRTHAGAELDLLFVHAGRQYGVEFKYADAPGMTKSMHSALSDLALEHLWVVYPGSETYRIHDRVTVIPLDGIKRCV